MKPCCATVLLCCCCCCCCCCDVPFGGHDLPSVSAVPRLGGKSCSRGHFLGHSHHSPDTRTQGDEVFKTGLYLLSPQSPCLHFCCASRLGSNSQAGLSPVSGGSSPSAQAPLMEFLLPRLSMTHFWSHMPEGHR